MSKDLTSLVFTIFLLFSTITNYASTSSTPDRESDYALIINSYTESSEWSNSFIYPIYRALERDDSDAIIHTEHMNMLMVDNERDLQQYKDYLFTKFSYKNPKVVVLVGNSAWGLLHEDIESRWASSPAILCVEDDYTGPEEAYLTKQAIAKESRTLLTSYDGVLDITILHSPIYIKQTIDLMSNMIPNMDKIMFLSDNRQISAQNRLYVEDIVAKYYPNVTIENLISDKFSRNKINDTLGHASKTTGILYFSWFRKTKQAGNIILTTNDYRMFRHYTTLPIFTLTDNSTSLMGMLGGYFTDNKSREPIIINTFRNVLLGNDNRKVTKIVCGKPAAHFDYTVLTEKRIPDSICPDDTIFYSKQLSFLEQYKYQILSILIFTIAIFAFLIMRISMLGKIKSKQSEKLLLIQNYSSLFENMPIAYSKQKIEYDSYGTISGYTITDKNPYYEQYFSNSDAPHDRDKRLTSLYQRAIIDNKSITVQYYDQQTSRYFSIIIVPSKVAQYLDTFYIDNTELASTQQLLRTVNHKLVMALDVANIVPWRWDFEQNIVVYDEDITLSTILNTESEKHNIISSEKHFSMIHEQDIDRITKAFDDLKSGETTKIKEEYRIHPDNNKDGYEWIETQAVVDKRDEAGNPISIIGSSLIISDRKKIESDLIEAKNNAEESNRLKSAFLANMSHEIRTPLNAIIGFSEVLATAEDENEKREYVSIIENNNTLLLQLISDILDLSKIEAGALDFNYADTDLKTMFFELTSSFNMRLGESEVKIVYDNEHDRSIVINTDKNRLTQVIINMVNNAMKFTKQGGINYGYKFKDDKTLYFYVTDTGSGIPSKDIEHVFGRFVKLNNYVQGTGLGLSICQTIIQNMGGKIGVESVEGQGSTFWFTIPYKQGDIIEHQCTETEHIYVEKNKLSVLIAEDNASNYKLFESILKNDYIIHHAWDGEEAVKMYKEFNPHIILMDINMPKLNGYEATEQIRKISAKVPIIAVTAYAYSKDKITVMDSGFDGYAAKPIDSKTLKSQMINLLKRQLIFM